MRMCHLRGQNRPFDLNNIFWYKPLLLLRACTLRKTWAKEGEVKISQKYLLGGGGSEIFILKWGVILLVGRAVMLRGRGSHNLKEKLNLHKTSIKSIFGITNLIYFRDNASAKFCILPIPFSWNSRVWSFSHPSWKLKQIFLEDF